METGRTVILLNLENLYESLYDVLNQVSNGVMNSVIYNLRNNSITLTYKSTDMLTLDCKVIVSSAGWMISLSTYAICLMLSYLTMMLINFRMILIAEKERVYKEFPTPLINRLEKHFVDTSTILTKPQKEIVDRLKEWAQDFTTVAKLDNL